MISLYMDVGGTHTRYQIEGLASLIKGIVSTGDIDLVSFIESLIDRYGVFQRIGISFAGQVVDNRIVSSPNVRVPEEDLVRYFGSRYGCDVRIENDLKCAALAEYNQRRDARMLTALFIGSGIGSASVYNGALLRGSRNLAGEIGHVRFKEAPFRCGCGLSTCVELFSSGTALKRWFDFYSVDEKPTLENLKRIERMQPVLNNFYEGLSLVASVISKLLDPDVVVLGGGVIEANQHLVDFLREEFNKYCFYGTVSVVKSQLDDAPLKGAKLLFEFQ